MSPKRSVVPTRLSDQRGRFWRDVVGHLVLPRRVNAFGVGIVVLAAIALQPLTPAQAATLWSQTAHAQVAHSSKPQLGSDPAYEPPPKHGTNYVAPTSKQGSPKSTSGAEKLNLRTRNSRTYSSGGRQLTTLVYPGSINYRDASGVWQAIDDSLVKTPAKGNAYQNRANRYTVYLPADIASQPIRIALGSNWLSFSLKGAKGALTLSGSTATYRNVLPGVDVVVEAQADTVEESLVLHGPSSPSQFTYEVQMSSGLKLNSVGDGFTVVDASGVGFKYHVGDHRGAKRLLARASYDVAPGCWRH